MEAVTKNEMRVLLTLFKDVHTNYNSNNLSKMLGLTPMGTLKIMKKMERQAILSSRRLGKAVFYRLTLESEYTRSLIRFLLSKEAEESLPRVRRWVKELRRLQGDARIGIIFGSVLRKEDYADVDLLLVLDQSQDQKANKAIKDMDSVSAKNIHAVKQTLADLQENIARKDKVVINALKTGIVIFGYDKLIGVVKSVAC